MAGHPSELNGGDAGGGLFAVVMCVSGSALALLALPSLFGLGAVAVPLATIASAVGGAGLLVAGIALALASPRFAGAAPGRTTPGAHHGDAPDGRAA